MALAKLRFRGSSKNIFIPACRQAGHLLFFGIILIFMSITTFIWSLIGLSTVVALGILCQFKKFVTIWLKFHNSLGMGKREINDKAFSLYRVMGIIWIVMGALTLCLSILSLLSLELQGRFYSLFY